MLFIPEKMVIGLQNAHSLPGCISQAKTKQEAVNNIREAIEGYIAVLEEDGLPIPEERFEALILAV